MVGYCHSICQSVSRLSVTRVYRDKMTEVMTTRFLHKITEVFAFSVATLTAKFEAGSLDWG